MNVMTIDVPDEPFLLIEQGDEPISVKYAFSMNEYENLELLVIRSKSIENTPVFECDKFSAHNLKYLYLEGRGSVHIFENLYKTAGQTFQVPEILFNNTGIHCIPEFVLEMRNLNSLVFQGELFREIPRELFQLSNLQKLRFFDHNKIRNVPDEINQLINLKRFDFWDANIDYLSPELILLPNIEEINFAHTTYKPSSEVMKCISVIRKKRKIVLYDWDL